MILLELLLILSYFINLFDLNAWQALRFCRGYLRRQYPYAQRKHGPILPVLVESMAFGMHMVIAYWVMLLVMLYESAIFIAIILGLTFGYFTFEIIARRPGGGPGQLADTLIGGRKDGGSERASVWFFIMVVVVVLIVSGKGWFSQK